MSALVAFTYDGGTDLQAVCTGLAPTTEYNLFSNDADSISGLGTSDSNGNLVLNVTGIGGLNVGDTVYALVTDNTSDQNPVACTIIKFGTPGINAGLAGVTWTYDGGGGGTGHVAVTFPSVNGIDYELSVDSNADGTVLGDGTTKVLTYSTLNYGTETSFFALLYLATTGINYAIRIFTSGEAGVGFDGQAPGEFFAYATTADLFRVLRVNSPTPAQTVAAQGDIDTATIEINGEMDWKTDHVPADTQELELLKGVCIDRAADLWRHRESAPGILGIVDETVSTTPGRYSWARYAARLSVLKDQWGLA